MTEQTPPSIDAGVRRRFVETALAGLPPETLAVLGEASARCALEAEIDTVAARIGDVAAATDFHAWCPIDGAALEDYMPRVVTAGGEIALASIRFKGGDRTQPFVHLHASTRPGAPDVALRRALAGAWSVFGPSAVRWFDPRPIASLAGDVRPDLRIVAGSLATVRAHRPASADRLRVARATGLDWYDRYVAGYEEYFREYPALVGDLNYETRETLQRMIDGGTLLEAWHGDDWAGVIGTWRERDHVVDGWVVVERMLVPEHRGHGLGAALVWHLASTLVEEHGEPERRILFGTIAPANVRSRRSAESVGRIDVGGYLFADVT